MAREACRACSRGERCHCTYCFDSRSGVCEVCAYGRENYVRRWEAESRRIGLGLGLDSAMPPLPPMPPPTPRPVVPTLVKPPAPLARAYCPTCGLSMQLVEIAAGVRALLHGFPYCKSFEELDAKTLNARIAWNLEAGRG